MPEHDDPIRLLETFGTGGVRPSPLEPAQVRRLGDRRRARRRAAYVVAAAAAVVLAIVPVAVLNGRDDTAPPVPAHSVGPTPTAPTATPPQVITYPGAGVEVSTAADADKLTGTSPEFRSFIVGQAQQAIADGASCPDAAHGVAVQKYSTAGYATGSVNSCGGYQALWVSSATNDGAWGEAQGTQDAWDCDALTYLQVPTSFTGPCADEAGTFATPGAGGPQPGMSKAQLTALGLIVDDPVAGADPTNCPGVRYSTQVLPSRVAGLWDAQDGLVDVAATTNMKTAERIGLGSARHKVVAAYPQGHYDQSGDYIVPRPADTTLFITFRRGMVAGLSWRLTPKHCDAWLP